MLKVQTASSNTPDAALAGKECAQKIKHALHDPKLVFVYSGVSYNQQALLKAIGEELPGVPLIGNTSFSGVVTQDGFVTGEKGYVGIMALSDADLTERQGWQKAELPAKRGETLQNRLSLPPVNRKRLHICTWSLLRAKKNTI